MKNYVKKGDYLTITSSELVKSGDVIIVGNLIGIATTDAAVGDPLTIATRGVYELLKAEQEELDLGATAYFKAGKVTKTAAGAKVIGLVVERANGADATCQVKLN